MNCAPTDEDDGDGELSASCGPSSSCVANTLSTNLVQAHEQEEGAACELHLPRAEQRNCTSKVCQPTHRRIRLVLPTLPSPSKNTLMVWSWSRGMTQSQPPHYCAAAAAACAAAWVCLLCFVHKARRRTSHKVGGFVDAFVGAKDSASHTNNNSLELAPHQT